MTDREKYAFLHGVLRGIELVVAMYDSRPPGSSMKDSEDASHVVVEQMACALGGLFPEEDEISGEIDANMRMAGILPPALPHQSN
jgi:hypothetical protein